MDHNTIWEEWGNGLLGGTVMEQLTAGKMGRYNQWIQGPRTQDQGTQGYPALFES